MPLASEDKSYIRDLLHEVRDVQKQTNNLLEEIRDLLKSPPVTVSGNPDHNKILRTHMRLHLRREQGAMPGPRTWLKF